MNVRLSSAWGAFLGLLPEPGLLLNAGGAPRLVLRVLFFESKTLCEGKSYDFFFLFALAGGGLAKLVVFEFPSLKPDTFTLNLELPIEAF